MAPELKKEPLNAEEIALLHQKMYELAVLGNIVDGFTYQTISRCLATIDAKDATLANAQEGLVNLAAGIRDGWTVAHIRDEADRILASLPKENG